MIGAKMIPQACFSDAQLSTETLGRVMTPALLIYPNIVDDNIVATLRLVNGQIDRWRPHVKTAKLEATMRQFVARGIRQFKCATTLELLTACEAGGRDLLMAYPSIGARARRVREIASRYKEVRVSVVVENAHEVEAWRGSRIDLFIDINPGMDRTGIDQWRTGEIVQLARKIELQKLRFAGLHYYDGHLRHASMDERKVAAYAGYAQLLALIEALHEAKVPVAEVVTSGTPTLPCALAFPGFKIAEIKHKVSAGTVVYNDLTSLSQLPVEWGYKLAALVVTTVISHPAPGLITCDAGLKTVSVDRGFPNCAVLGFPELEPVAPSEEHLCIRVPRGTAIPEIGGVLYLAPRHVCTTVNNFDHALLVQDGRILDVVPVSARGREAPLLKTRRYSSFTSRSKKRSALGRLPKGRL